MDALKIILLISTLTVPGICAAQDASYYTCSGQANPVTIPGLPLAQALEIYTEITRCPVSVDIKPSDTAKRRKITTRAVKGTLRPDAALRQMVAGTKLKVRPIKGGYSIY